MRRIIPLFIICIAVAFASRCSYSTSKFDSWGNNEPSFDITATYDRTTRKVTISWDDSDKIDHGYDIFRTENPNDEFADYEYITSSFSSPYVDDVWSDKGVYYYRVAKYESLKPVQSAEYKEYSTAAMVNIQP